MTNCSSTPSSKASLAAEGYLVVIAEAVDGREGRHCRRRVQLDFLGLQDVPN
jgi:hypothetical protein